MILNDSLTLVLMAATMFLWGSAPLFEKLGLSDVDPLTGVLIRSTAVTLVLFVLFLFTGRVQELSKLSLRSISLFAASGIMAGLLGQYAYFCVLKGGMASKVVPIVASYPLVTAILSILILREGITLQRVAGIILAVIGIALIKQS